MSRMDTVMLEGSNGHSSKIAIFENQIIQFRCLATFFNSKGYKVWPNPESEGDDGFRQLMNAMHVYLNKQYSSQIEEDSDDDSDDYRTQCRDFFCQSLKDWKPDLLIIDHKLSPPYGSLDGFDLADFLFGLGFTCPVVFLSRSDRYSREVVNGLERIRKSGMLFEWLPKGYQGEIVLDEEFLNTIVLKTVKQLLESKSSKNGNEDKTVSTNSNDNWPKEL